MKIQELKNILNKGIINNLYYFYGEEVFFIEECVELIKSKVINPKYIELNYNIFYGDSLDFESLINSINTFPFMSRMRVVLVKETDKLSDKIWEELLLYMDKPSPFTCLIFYSERVDRDKVYIQKLDGKSCLVQSNKLRDSELFQWIKREFLKSEKDIDDECIKYLMTFTNNNLLEINSEVNKILLFKEDKRYIRIGDIVDILNDNKTYSIFKLIDYILVKDRKKALIALKSILEKNTPPPLIIGLIYKRLRTFLEAAELNKIGLSRNQLIAKLKDEIKFQTNFFEQLNSYTYSEILQAYRLLNEVDMKIKTGRINRDVLIEKLVFDLTAETLS